MVYRVRIRIERVRPSNNGIGTRVGIKDKKVLKYDNCTVIELEHGMCRWPTGNSTGTYTHLFCARPAELGKPYCKKHCKAAYQPLRKPAVRAPAMSVPAITMEP